MKRLLSLSLCILLSLSFLSCLKNSDDSDWSEECIIEISSEIIPVNTFLGAVVDGMRVRVKGERDWMPCPITFIEGFVFEPGYFYTLKVKITHLANPPQDSGSVQCELITLISKTAAEGLPA